MSDAQPEFQIELHVLWVGLDEMPVVLANQYVAQIQQDEIIISFGQVTPPVLLGTPEQQRQTAETLSYIPVTPHARITLTRNRLAELIDVLTTTLSNYDQSRGRAPGS